MVKSIDSCDISQECIVDRLEVKADVSLESRYASSVLEASKRNRGHGAVVELCRDDITFRDRSDDTPAYVKTKKVLSAMWNMDSRANSDLVYIYSATTNFWTPGPIADTIPRPSTSSLGPKCRCSGSIRLDSSTGAKLPETHIIAGEKKRVVILADEFFSYPVAGVGGSQCATVI